MKAKVYTITGSQEEGSINLLKELKKHKSTGKHMDIRTNTKICEEKKNSLKDIVE